MASAVDSNKIRTYYLQPTVGTSYTFCGNTNDGDINGSDISLKPGFKSMYNREDV